MQLWKRLPAACVIGTCSAFIALAPGPRAGAQTAAADTAAAGIVIDRVVATIEDRAIMQSEVENEL